jgi:ABC-type uncharacterized transport system YnjBCD permease subunit
MFNIEKKDRLVKNGYFLRINRIATNTIAMTPSIATIITIVLRPARFPTLSRLVWSWLTEDLTSDTVAVN